jgi:hypothetical protein
VPHSCSSLVTQHGKEETYERSSNIKLAAERLRIWGDALNMLAQPEMAARLIEILEAGNHKDLDAVIERTGLLQKGVCRDFAEICTKVVNFSLGRFEERCDVVVTNFSTPYVRLDDTHERAHTIFRR